MGGTHGTHNRTKSQDLDSISFEKDVYEALWLQCVEKSFIFVWCDASIGTQDYINDNENTITRIARIVNQNGQLVHTFNELNACREFITQINNVCLIISGTMGEELVPQIHNFEQIHSIYIFCLNKPKHDLWALNYHKVRGVCTNITDICESLKSYIISRSSIDYDRIEFDVINREINSPTIDKHELCLIYSKLIKIILLNMDSFDHGKQDMINYCRNQYTSEYQIQLLNDFERNYSQYNPIWWYTKNCFLQGIINRALRTHDLYVLCSMHRFIKDMDLKLGQLHENQRKSNESIKLYFGQFLSEYDFNRLSNNRGGLMCINQFLSVNSEQGVAMMFLKQQNFSTSNENKIRVVFQIYIDQTIQSNVSYANIGSISQFVHEKEYLISMSSVYRIDKIEKLVDISSGYFVKLILIGRNDLQYNNLTQYIQKEQLDEEINLTELGHIIKNRLHPFKSANKLFKQALFKKKQELRSIILHYNMAIIYDALNEYDKSLEEYRCVLNIARDFIPNCHQKDDLCLVPLFSNMALTYQQKNKFTYALTYAFRALGITLNIQNDAILKKEFESSCYYNLGLIHDQEGKFFDAKAFYEQALRVRQEYLPLGHSDITVLQRLITLISAKRSDSE
jgi:tetratricopeptide (TPR) repeat protein